MTRTDAPPPSSPTPPGAVKLDIAPKLLIDNWRAEIDAITLYRSLARHEREPERASILLDMAKTEERHAAIMAARLQEMGVPLPKHGVGLRTRLIILLSRIFGARALLPVIEGMEAKGVNAYRQPEQDPAVQALAADERGHFRTLGRMSRGGPSAPPTVEIAQHERWHRSAGGGTLRASIFGVSDGLLSNLSLLMGFAGAQADSKFIVLAGIAGLLAGASSMAAGEYISMRSQRELFERQIKLEETELLLAPEEERAELALIYRAKGVPAAEAEQLADRILENKETALETLVREELGLDPSQLGSPWGASIGSFFAFAIGAVVPVIPYFTGAGWLQLTISALLSGAALFAVGVGVSLFTGRDSIYSGLRQLLIGAAVAGITYGIGTAIGAGTGI
jgi:VIT1/CCC1 family predicted Fe2+/Mn2+ transporter